MGLRTVWMVLGIKLHEVQGVLILHTMVTLGHVDNDMIGAELLRKRIHLGVVQSRVFDIFGIECLDYRFGGEQRLQLRPLIPSKNLEVDGLVQVADVNTMQNRLCFFESL